MEKGLHISEGFEIFLDLPPLRLKLNVAIEVDLKQEVLVRIDVILLLFYGLAAAKVILTISLHIQIKPLTALSISNYIKCIDETYPTTTTVTNTAYAD